MTKTSGGSKRQSLHISLRNIETINGEMEKEWEHNTRTKPV